MSFAELGLNPLVLKSLETTGYACPTPVQRQAIPAALAGRDLLVSSHTGSGKTAAFLLPSLHRLAESALSPEGGKSQGPRLLVLCPTRELAQQVEKQARTYGKGLRRLRSACLVGGAAFGPQFQALKAHPEILIATPGRLIDHLERGRIDFSHLEVLVLDEADRMLDMGFVEDIENIVARTPESRQTLLFSATLDGSVARIAREMTRDPQRIEVAIQAEHKANIDQRLLFVDDVGHKHRLLDHLLRDAGLTQAVVFTATKRSAEDLSESLLEQGFSVAALHGDMPQHKRNRTLQRLREGITRVLVATDVAARGIDVVGISHVINFDIPRQVEDYVHRIGRTGRAGRTGMAYTLVHGKERGLVRDIERYTGEKVRIDVIPGLEPRARIDHEPRRKSASDWKTRPGEAWRGKPRAGQPSGLGPGAGGGAGWQGRERWQTAERGTTHRGSRPQGPVQSRDARPEQSWARPSGDKSGWKKGNSWTKGGSWGERGFSGTRRGRGDA
ncbi:MAG TPA: DEAD/DEAH box helicase [Thiobacillaceae bacterium]|nr:DEAD/DEAH box helicase [Thiobacillaceae bacterium]HNU64342.1 DEAD/DEAH box helicase [Thiobacillaceae bacterium]